MKMILPIRRVLAVLAVVFLAFTASAQMTVMINEVLADNETAFITPDGDSPDFIELYNFGTTSNVLSNFRLTKDPTKLSDNSFTYIFPAGSGINSNSYLLIICDGNTNQRYHANVDIGKTGEKLYLLSPQSVTHDSVTFGFQATDYSIGRTAPAKTAPFVLCFPSPGGTNIPIPAAFIGNRARVRFNEWMPSRGDNDDWFEIYNPEPFPVPIADLVFSDRTNTGFGAGPMFCTNRAIAKNSWMGAGAFLRFFADDHAEQGNDQVDFKLTSLGEAASPPEHLTLFTSNRVNVIHTAYWTNAQLDVSYGYLPDGYTSNAVVTFPVGRDTPGESNFLPIENVLINEILAHADPPLEDTIELYNPTGTNVDVGGWWLSDDKQIYNKYRIPPGTTISPNGYLVFYEWQKENTIWGFNTNGLGIAPSFALSSSQGDQVYLYSVFPGTTTLNGYRRGVDFPASQNGQSYGRWVTSTGESDFVPMESLTFGTDITRNDPTNRLDEYRTGTGAPNGLPFIGPIVVSEIMYHPPDTIIDTNIIKNELDEYVEIYNRTTTNVLLYDPLFPTNTWRLRGDIGFEFPRNLTLGPGKSLLVCNFGMTNTVQSNVFRFIYNVPADVPMFGAYRGKLSDGGAAVEIERPDFPQGPGHPDEGFVPYLRVDRVRYNDELPWPVEADGVRVDVDKPDSVGYSLTRRFPEQYGSEPTNWVATPPTPGFLIISNTVMTIGNNFFVTFDGLAGCAYTVETVGNLGAETWQPVQQFPAQSTSGPRQVITNVVPGGKRFYRVRTQ